MTSLVALSKDSERILNYTISRKREEEAISVSSLGEARRKNGANKRNPIWTFSKSWINNERHLPAANVCALNKKLSFNMGSFCRKEIKKGTSPTFLISLKTKKWEWL